MAIEQVVRKENFTATALKAKIETRDAKVAVIGLGYVGLPLAVAAAKVGFEVLGIDSDIEKVQRLNHGENYIKDVDDEELVHLLDRNKFRAFNSFGVISKADVVIICVPTPLNKSKEPDMSYIDSASTEIAKYLREGQVIILESTTYPGTTEEVILPKLEKTGLRVGQDFFLAYSPERVDPGNMKFKTNNTSRIVGGVTPYCLEVSYAFYSQTIDQVITVSSPAAAEMAKVLENTYRAVNIALVNEIMLLCDKMGLEVWEVIDAAATKPFGFQAFYPGPGVGGHCIPIDPFYLSWKAKQYNASTDMIDAAGKINDKVPQYVITKIMEALNIKGKCLNGANVLILGVAYKKDIADWRETPALPIINLLNKQKAVVNYVDKYIPMLPPNDVVNEPMFSVDLTEETIKQADCVVIVTNHSSIDYQWVVDNAQLVVDTRNVTKTLKVNANNVIKL